LAAARFLLIPLAGLAGFAQAIGLGEISQQSAFGTSLRVVVPVLAGTVEELAGECVKLVSAQQSRDGIPEVLNARIALERTPTGARIVVMSPRAVTDPVLKLTLQAGCDSVVRREYVLLMDPLPIDVPVAQEDGGQRAATAAPVAEPARTSASDGPAAGAARAIAAVPARRAPPRRRATAMAVAPAAGATGGAAGAPKSGAATAKAAPKAATTQAARPKLTVSTAVPVVEAEVPGRSPGPATTAGAAVAGARAASPQANSSAALDAEAAALQQRVAELTGMVDRMQQEMRATEARQAAQGNRIAAEKAARTSPQAIIGRWWNENWPLLVGVVGLAALIAAVLSYRRRRATVASGQWRLETTSQGRAESRQPAPRPMPVAATAPPESVEESSPGPQGTAAPATATTVDVSELSHVTEEAGVYLAFNRPERAIEVLREHIRADPRSLPAAWLMLLDLYHAQGNESEFRALAEKFHARFNAQTPTWDAYRPLAQSDPGLEAFPHLIRQLVPVWSKPECREFLDRLLHENRDGRRTGFSLTAYEDIIFLRQLADTVSGDGTAGRPVQLPPVIAPAPRTPTPSAAALVATARRPPTLDLELSLDEDMLEAGKSASVGTSAPRPAKDTPKQH
jgi:hypothetical protein